MHTHAKKYNNTHDYTYEHTDQQTQLASIGCNTCKKGDIIVARFFQEDIDVIYFINNSFIFLAHFGTGSVLLAQVDNLATREKQWECTLSS